MNPLHTARLMVLATATSLLMGSAALAANIHFVGPVTATVDGNLVIVEGKVAGIGNDPITYSIEIDAELTVYLINPGAKSHRPFGQNKEPLKTFAEGVLDISVKNGQFTFTIVVDLTDAINEALDGAEAKKNWTVEQGPLEVNSVTLEVTQGSRTINWP